MCYGWYTIFDTIRTRREGLKRYALIAFHVVGDDLKVIIIKVNSIDKGFDNMPAEGWIRSVSLGELMKEENDAILIKELGLGILQGFDRDAEGLSIILQVFEHGGGGCVPDAGGNGLIYVPDLFQRFSMFRLMAARGECFISSC